MSDLQRFLALPARERRLVLSALLWLAAIRVGLALLPFRILWSLVLRLCRAPGAAAGAGPPPEQITWAVRVSGRYLPGAERCLPQALAALLLLERHSYPTRLRIGVAQGE
ncbi:MAG: lasso peptide biosynthesis B2 protein, partial [Dehalococcoidia bacterium]